MMRTSGRHRTASASIAWLAWRDFAHERRLSACQTIGLAAVLGPLLVLFGLKFGVVETMTARLREQPRIREVVGIGNREFGADWFRDVAARPDVAFVIPRTRSIATAVVLTRENGTAVDAELVPSAAGDPLVASAAPPASDGAVLSVAAATRLSVRPGDLVSMQVSRIVDGRRVQERLPLRVTAIALESALARPAAFVSLDLLDAVERFRDGIEVAERGWPGATAPPRDTWAGFRLYARSIFDVAGLQAHLRSQGLDVRTSAAEIDAVIELERNLTLLFWTIALMGAVGCVAAIAASLSANAERKRREMGVLRLIGYSARATALFPAVQATLVGVFGSVVALFAFVVTSETINARFASELTAGSALCTLALRHVVAAIALAVGCALLAALAAGRGVAQRDPSEALREV